MTEFSQVDSLIAENADLKRKVELLRDACESAMKAICYEDEAATIKGEYGLPFTVVEKIRIALTAAKDAMTE